MNNQTDNTDEKLKIKIREYVFNKIDCPVVLDLYCGSLGKMYQGIWHRASGYLGVDKNIPHSLDKTIKLSAEYAASKFDLSPFNVFDVDCYSSPWIVTRRLLKRISPGRYGFCLTSGEHRGLSNGNSNEVIRATLGLSGFSDLRLLVRYQRLVMLLMIKSLLDIDGVKIESGQIALTERGIAYIGLVVDKVDEI